MVVESWNRLPKEVAESAYLEGFKVCVGVTFGDVVLWWAWLCWVNGPFFADFQSWLKVI